MEKELQKEIARQKKEIKWKCKEDTKQIFHHFHHLIIDAFSSNQDNLELQHL